MTTREQDAIRFENAIASLVMAAQALVDAADITDVFGSDAEPIVDLREALADYREVVADLQGKATE